MNTDLKVKRREKSKQRTVRIKKSIRAKEKSTVGLYVHEEPADVFVDNRDVKHHGVHLRNLHDVHAHDYEVERRWDEPCWTYDSEDDTCKDFAGCGRDCDWCGRCMY